MGQFSQAAKITLEPSELRSRSMVGLSHSLAGVHLFLPQSGAERQQQVTGQQLDHLQGDKPHSPTRVLKYCIATNSRVQH